MAEFILPIIGYDNHLTNSSATVSGDGTNPENAYDWRTDDAWTTGAANGYLRAVYAGTQNCDYYAIAGHDLFTNGASVKLQYWTGAAYADVPNSSYTPTTDEAFMVIFTSVPALRYQLYVTTGGTAATIAVASFGVRLELERGLQAGFTPPNLSRRDVYYNNIAQSGAFIGRSLERTGLTGSIPLKNLSQMWMRVYLDPFIEAARTQGWFLMWAPSFQPTEVGYCWTTEPPEVRESGDGFMECTIKYNGLIE